MLNNEVPPMRCAGLILLVATSTFGAASIYADPAVKVPTIGQVWFGTATTAEPYKAAFQEGLHGLGYREGKDVRIVARYAHGDAAQLASLVNEMVTLDVDVMLVSHAAVPTAMKATKTIPIICATMADPVEEGFVESLARPGGNLTGLSNQAFDADAKRLDLAMELVPNLKRVGLLVDAGMPSHEDVSNLRRLTDKARVKLQVFHAKTLEEIEVTLDAIDKDRPQALIVFASPLFDVHRERIFGFTSTRLPVVSEGVEFSEAGALLTYSASWKDMFRRSAAYADRILKGAKPGDLPIEQPTKFNLTVNLKSAQAIRLKVPNSILLRADRIIR
jgi:putative ABC transport system substrate-binding protein